MVYYNNLVIVSHIEKAACRSWERVGLIIQIVVVSRRICRVPVGGGVIVEVVAK